MQSLPRILNKLWLRTVCLRDEKKKDLSLSSYHLCAEGCSHGALTPPWGDPHWYYSITCAATEKLWDRKLDSWRNPEMRHWQHRAGWNLPRAVNQSCGWNRKWKRWETVHRRHLISLENVLLALSKSIFSLLSIIKISSSRSRLAEGLNRKVKCIS